MTLIKPSGDYEPAIDMISVTAELYEFYVNELRDLIARLNAGEFEALAETKKIEVQLRAAMNSAVAERKRLDEEARKTAGVVHDYAIDFGSARDEIGRRLAKLRAARGANPISG
ncbi:hypothetical protein [Cochlodiniinecator piscidefendens]|uniref:hypothetical protein n=1 Tax=Cochlodiniinecator piscidefendens TaxID=2715756 RepID=UPI00140A5651|nr:hypothetical protein [Cochlodiniinecator piscidefendens]